jgi:hypothetical protein
MAAALGLACVSCHASFVDPKVPAAGSIERRWAHFYLFGLAGQADYDLDVVCGARRVRWVRTGGSVLTVGLTVLTLGIYAPRTLEVTCEPGAKP